MTRMLFIMRIQIQQIIRNGIFHGLSKDVVLVTGGAKGITAQCALEFARSTKAQMVLIGRSPMPENKKDNDK